MADSLIMGEHIKRGVVCAVQAIGIEALPTRGKFFFLVPVDPASNNIRVLVNRDQFESPEKLTSAA